MFHFSTYGPSSFKHYFVPSDTEVQSVVWQWLAQQPALFFASGIQKLVDRWDKMFKRTWTISWDLKHQCYNINVLNFFFLMFVCYPLVSYDSKLMEKITHGSTVNCILSDDVTIMRKDVCMFRIKFPIAYKTSYISDFSYFKNWWNGAVWNLFMQRPSYYDSVVEWFVINMQYILSSFVNNLYIFSIYLQ